ncbi:hypothetical protein [Methylocystis heyeri]|uniref:Uncharacterized protein n=1 Tax=Methylocystis heyeri TaxID=391905 RepID=A0A6B8KEI7_9HYPH|nr:hypothetical protein [Methylocystis heyeri]QGM46706.1 hypothetical protein H2LOC_013940 [Methylocystis heyeri]
MTVEQVYLLRETFPPGASGVPLSEFDGTPFWAVRLQPHPTVIGQWLHAGLYFHDLPSNCFRLTEAGRKAVSDARMRLEAAGK